MLPELALTTFQGPGVTDERVSTEALLAKLAQAATDNNVFVGTGIGYNEPFKRVDDLSKFTETVLEKEVRTYFGLPPPPFNLNNFN